MGFDIIEINLVISIYLRDVAAFRTSLTAMYDIRRHAMQAVDRHRPHRQPHLRLIKQGSPR